MINKKAIFFTFTSILFAAIFLLLAVRETSTIELTPLTSSISVTTVNAYVKSLEESYLPSFLKIAATKTIYTILCEENRTRSYIPLQSNIFPLEMNGTFAGGATSPCSTKFVQNYSMVDFLMRLKNISKTNLNIDLNMSVLSISMYQTEPWYLTSEMNVSVIVNNPAASWITNLTITSKIPVDMMDDPVFFVPSQGNYTNLIRKNERSIATIRNMSELASHLENMTYYENSYAPSFVMRMAGDLNSSNCCGISSLVNPIKVRFQNNTNQSFVDFLYFTGRYKDCSNGATLYNLMGLDSYPGFKLDFAHMTAYNLTANSTICTP
jgi:hypothetical protein